MRIYLVQIFAILMVFSCQDYDRKDHLKPISEVEIDTYYDNLVLSIRAIDILSDGNLAFAANNGVYGLIDKTSKLVSTKEQVYDSTAVHFRSVAHTDNDFFMLSIESPALLYKTGDHGDMELVYKEEGEGVFYDALLFWNNEEGIAIGDPTEGCLSIIITRDAGHSWQKIDCNNLPSLEVGEAAFAASNSNIAVVGDHTWIATGGMTSRILYSSNKGKTWEIYDTPMRSGSATTGIYSIAFYDELNGFAFGGDFTKPELNTANKMRTSDGGKTWVLVADDEEPGYRSCVQYRPGSDGKELIAIGFDGIDYSNDSGETWEHLSDEPFYTIRFIDEHTAFAAGQGRISKLSFR